MWQLRMHCNWRQPDPAQLLFALISSPMPSLKSLSLSVAVLGRFYCWYIMLRYDLELWPMILTFDLSLWIFVVYRLCHGQTLYQIWAKSSNPRRTYCDLNIWPYDLEHVSRVVPCSGIVCTKIKAHSSCPFMKCNYNLMRHVTLWPWTLTRWP